MHNMQNTIQKTNGKFGVLIPGLEAVATTFIAGVEAVRKGIALQGID
jgi:myo-inositol-1-phosphate synthase